MPMLDLAPQRATCRLHQARLDAGGGHTVELAADTAWTEAAAAIAGADEIAIRFASFKDGRGFSLATQLRQRAGFAGRLRAVGDLIPDQASALYRSGFDGVSPDRTDRDSDWHRARSRLTPVYQPAVNGPRPTRQMGHGQAADIATLNRRYRDWDAVAILEDAISAQWAGRIAMLSSFGAEAAIGLHLISRVAPDTPVIFLETGRLFAQTEQYRYELVQRLGLTRVRVLTPDADEAAKEDGDERLWRRDPDACCALRKVRPLNRVLADYDALVTGRKRFHGGERLALPVVESVRGRVRVNPLASWSAGDVEAYFRRHGLPQHPLADMGYASIGCWPCTAPAHTGESVRDGRWRGRSKTECGIHTAAPLAAE
ncbi:phosphoadenylyl-sulfate reductase [Maricaulis sp. CAU 1757]